MRGPLSDCDQSRTYLPPPCVTGPHKVRQSPRIPQGGPVADVAFSDHPRLWVLTDGWPVAMSDRPRPLLVDRSRHRLPARASVRSEGSDKIGCGGPVVDEIDGLAGAHRQWGYLALCHATTPRPPGALGNDCRLAGQPIPIPVAAAQQPEPSAAKDSRRQRTTGRPAPDRGSITVT
jgi:hypothetical protein